MLAAGSIVEIAAGLCLALGFSAAWAATALILFTMATSVTLFDFWRHDGVVLQGLRSACLLLAAAGVK